jgi:hypothetical protein
MANTPGDLNKEVKETADILKDAFMSLGAQIEDVFRRATTANDTFNKAVKKDLIGTLNSLARNSQQLLDNDYKLQKGQLASRDIAKQIYETTKKQAAVEASINRATFLTKNQQKKLVGETNDYFNQQLITLQDQLGVSTEIEGKLGTLPAIFESISKVPILGGLLKTNKAIEAMQQAAADGAGTMEMLGAGLSSAVSKAALIKAALTALIDAGFAADEQVTKLAKSLNQTKMEALGTRYEMSAIANASGDAFITTDKLLESTAKLGQQLGIAQTFSADLTKEFTSLTGKIGISEESAGGLAKLTVAMGKNARTVTTEALGTAQALQSQAGIQLDNKQILDEVGKVSGQLLANFKGNPTAIAAAVTQAKLLGTTLEQTKKQSESLLDFQSSIENELKAELITGQQLNLERARALALSGDQAGVAKELANQNMNFNKFSQMNVLAQKDFAAALGLSADELSDQLLKQQYLNKSTKEVAALAGEDVARRLEALTAQDKFNNAVSKLQDILVRIVDGPIGMLLDGLASTLSLLAGDTSGFKAMFGADDLMSGYGQRTLSTPQGSYALNNNDTVIAGTNLFRGNDVYSGPAGALSLGGGGAVVDAIDKLGDRINQLSERPVIARPSEFATPISIKQLQNIRRSV